jgi:hypothetical protein
LPNGDAAASVALVSIRLLVLVLVAACSGGGHPSEFGTVPIEDVNTDAKRAICEFETRCGQSPDVATCMGANVPISLGFDADMVNAIAAGKVIFDATKYGQCLDALAAESCDRTSQSARYMPDACAEAITGTVPYGEACQLNAECMSQVCNLVPPCANGCCTGTCVGGSIRQVDLAIGESCNSERTCVAGTYCNGVCTALKPAGAACGGDDQCGYGLACSMSSATCAPLPAVGQPCPDRKCRDVGTHCDTSGTCVKDGLPGDSCTAIADCASMFYQGLGAYFGYAGSAVPAARFICDANAQCAVGPELGATCSDTTSCFDDATFCDAASTCVSLLADGTACTMGFQCASNYCDTVIQPITNTCKPRSCF